MNNHGSETRFRSFVKASSWRLSGFVILGLVSFAITGKWGESLLVSGVFNFIRFILYYFHERWWNRIKWGRVPPPVS